MWHSIFCFFVKITGWLPYFFCFRTKTYYEDKKVQSRKIKGKAIIISNHLSVYDVALMMFTFFGRTLRCLIAEIMFTKNFIFSWFLKGLGGIKVERQTNDFTFIDKSCKILQKGGVVEIYPESRLPLKTEEPPLPFKSSAAYIALLSGAPIIPVYTNGCYFKKERARVIIGKPIDVRKLYDESLTEKENLQNISDTLRNKILELKDELERQSNKKGK